MLMAIYFIKFLGIIHWTQIKVHSKIIAVANNFMLIDSLQI